MHTILAVLGRQPEFSAAEIAALVGDRVRMTPLTSDVLHIDGVDDPSALFAQLGGTVKFAVPVGTIQGVAQLHDEGTLRLCGDALEKSGKAIFGFSVYGTLDHAVREVHALGKELKRALKERGQSARFVTGAGSMLSSVTVAKNHLLEKGAEFLLIVTGKDIRIARTIAVQPFEDFSERDYGRPGRDARSGMLPPKLARMLVNLSGPPGERILLDPFCGSGTVLTEALLLGYRGVYGSDVAPKAVQDAQRNIQWTRDHASAPLGAATVTVGDVRLLGKMFRGVRFAAIVTEPFLGPPQHGRETPVQLATLSQQLAVLYTQALEAFAKLLPPGGRVVFLLPFFSAVGGRALLQTQDIEHLGFAVLPPLPETLLRQYRTRFTERGTLLYQRPGQRVGREVLLLEKKEV